MEADLFHYHGAAPNIVRFDTLCLRFSAGNEWHGARWEFEPAECATAVAADQVEEVSSRSGQFPVKVIDGDGACVGSLFAQTILCGYPSHSFCFMFCADDNGMWSGHTVARSFGHLVIAPHKFDPY